MKINFYLTKTTLQKILKGNNLKPLGVKQLTTSNYLLLIYMKQLNK